MYANSDITIERAEAYKAALEAEKEGYEARLAAKKNGRTSGIGSDLTEEQLLDRIKQVDDEIKRVDKQIDSKRKERDKS